MNAYYGRREKRIATALFAVSLASCGGGGGNDRNASPAPPPVSTAPAFTSSGSANVIENTQDEFYTATARDPQNDSISFRIAGGADADKFVIEQDGTLRFDRPPNFDLPVDADADNVYEVTLSASAGGETDTLMLRVTVTNDKEGVSVTRVASRLNDPVGFSFIHNSPELLVAEAGGRVLFFDPENGRLTENGFIRDNKRPGEILAIAYAFPDSSYQEGVYIVTHDPQDGLYLQAFNSDRKQTSFVRLGDPWSEPVNASLQAQGSLYVAIGDARGNLAQNSSSPYGKLIEVPTFNVYGGASLPRPDRLVVAPRIIGDGIQMPGGFSPAADFLYLADQGSSVEHELAIFQRDWRPLDFGWPFYEGSKAIVNDPPAQILGPTLVYDVGNGTKEGVGIVAGLLNDGNFFEELGDVYVFADRSGKVFTVPRERLSDGFRHSANVFELRTRDFEPDRGTIDMPIGFTLGFGSDHFYILDGDGEIFRVEGAP